MAGIQITRWNHEILRTFAVKGGFYIDATMGNGKDTCFLCGLAGEKGRVLAFDIQPAALENTEKLLERKGLFEPGKAYIGRSRAYGSVCAKGKRGCDLL